MTPTCLSVLSMPARTEHTCTYKYMLVHTFTSSDATDTHLSQRAEHASKDRTHMHVQIHAHSHLYKQ